MVGLLSLRLLWIVCQVGKFSNNLFDRLWGLITFLDLLLLGWNKLRIILLAVLAGLHICTLGLGLAPGEMKLILFTG